ncbi:hypothetical protein ZIOFF_048841 [Zingiber officinale]|uniref:PDZ domain-containing protein n=1 Tax=Zingiber officinale TaxID=94328 RepID=A0A8J5FRS6_ZINOF|nr:hypothetical protein ZIOFF_048841 [Zingiber officinale]
MAAPNLKAETISLMDMRASMEAEMDAIIESLCGPSGPGLSGNLVDSEGFPRTDIDLSAVRSQRRRLAELQNDYKDITGQIEKNLQVLHSLNKVTPLPPVSSDVATTVFEVHTIFAIFLSSYLYQTSYGNLPQGSPMIEDPVLRVPFAIIDEIADDSPSAEDGLQLGDEIVKFGNVQMGDELQARLLAEAQSNHGNPIHMEIVRQGVLMHATVTPRAWRGRGLLGREQKNSRFAIFASCDADVNIADWGNLCGHISLIF